MKRLIYSVLAILALVACNSNKYEFEANFPGRFDGKMAVIANYDDSVALDSILIENGKFYIEGKADYPKLAQIMIEGKTRAYVVLEPGVIHLADSLYIATGTPLNDELRLAVDEINAIDDSEGMSLYLDAVEQKYNKYKENPFGIYFATELVRFKELPQIDSILKEAPQVVKDSKRVARYRDAALLRSTTMPGKNFIDFFATQPNGNIMRLSDYAGKGDYILVDFWASWCPYCIKEFPDLKILAEKYKDKNFKILGVAVRDKAEDTKASINKHELTWDIMYNAERIPYNIYGFTGIPHLMLIGPDGVIISRGESPKQIEAYLDNQFATE